jgi:chromosome partitioning protein
VSNCASTNPLVQEDTELRDAVEGYEELVMSQRKICERISYRKSIKNGLAVTEMPEIDEKAVFELNALYKEIYHVAT